MEWSSLTVGVLTTLLATGTLALLRALWENRRPQGTLVASYGPPTSQGWDVTATVQWRGEGAAWHVLALPYDRTTAMARGRIEAHVLRDGDDELKFQLRHPARVALLWRPGIVSKSARGHVLDTATGFTRPLKQREVRDFLGGSR